LGLESCAVFVFNKGDSAAYCAKRFAAKEAFAKALGTIKLSNCKEIWL
jgi:phosphopantetheinyl transferase (holo-ACP synthase)